MSLMPERAAMGASAISTMPQLAPSRMSKLVPAASGALLALLTLPTLADASRSLWLPPRALAPIAASPQAGSVLATTGYARDELWLKWGQSNAVGFDGPASTTGTPAQGALLPYGADAPHRRVFEISHGPGDVPFTTAPTGELQILRSPASDDAHGIGFGQTFGRVRANAFPGINRLCISNRAIGQTGFYGGNEKWLATPSAEGMAYKLAIDEAEAFLDSHPSFVFAGILWHQGEADVNGMTSGSAYQAALVELITETRARLRGGAESVFICGTMLKPWLDSNPGAADIDAVHRSIANLVPRASFIDCDSLINKADMIHFGRADLRAMGKLFAARAASLLEFCPTQTPPAYRFSWDGACFSSRAGDGGVILEQSFSEDPDRGIVLDTQRATGVSPFPCDVAINRRKYTVAMWVNPRSTSGASSYFSGGVSAAGKGHFMTRLCVGHGAYNAAIANPGIDSLAAQTWSHIAITYDGREFLRYINGAAIGTALTNHASPLEAPMSGTIGGYAGNPAFTLNGMFDDIVIAPFVMTPAEILELAQ